MSLEKEKEIEGEGLALILKSIENSVEVLQSIYESPEEASLTKQLEKMADEGIDYNKAVKHYKVTLIKQALLLTNGNQTRAAEILNLKLSTLNAIIKRYNIELG